MVRKIRKLTDLASIVEDAKLPADSLVPQGTTIVIPQTSEPTDDWFPSSGRMTSTSGGQPVPGIIVRKADLLAFGGSETEEPLSPPGIGSGTPPSYLKEVAKFRDWLKQPDAARERDKTERFARLLEELAYLVVVDPVKYEKPALKEETSSSEREFKSGEVEFKSLLVDIGRGEVVGAFGALATNTEKLQVSTRTREGSYQYERQAALTTSSNELLIKDLEKNTLGALYYGIQPFLKGGMLIGPDNAWGKEYRLLPFDDQPSSETATGDREAR